MTNFRIAAFALVALASATPAFADHEPRTVENLFPGWTAEATGLPSANRGQPGERVRDFAVRDQYQTGDQLAVAPENRPGRTAPRFSFPAFDDSPSGPYSRH